MAKKVNSFFRKSYAEKEFEKKLLSKAFMKDEKELLLSVYEKRDNLYVLKNIENRETLKKLDALAKEMKKNRGALKAGKAGAVAAIAVLITVFTVFFQNPLAEKGMEKALERIFGAQSEITGLRLSLFGGYIKYSSLQVADRDDLDKNLFQTGKTEIDLDMSEVLKGKFASEEVRLEDLALGAKRAARAVPLAPSGSGDKNTSGQEGKKGEGIDSLSKAAALLPENPVPDRDTVRKYINDNISSLSSPSAAAESAREAALKVKSIEEQSQKTGNDIEALKKEADVISKTKLSSPLDIAGAKKLAERIKTASATVKSITAGIEAAKKDIAQLKKSAAESKNKIGNAVNADMDFIVSKFPPPGAFSLSSLAESASGEMLAPLMDKYGSAYEIIMRLRQAGGDNGKEKKAEQARRGRDVKFTVYRTPSFHIRHVYGSFNTGGENRHSVEISDITNDQELLGRPLVFSIKSEAGKIKTEASGFFDTREKSDVFSSLDTSVSGGRLSGISLLSPAGIESFDSGMDISLKATLSREKNISGKVNVSLPGPELRASSKTGEIIKKILEDEKSIDFAISYRYTKGDLSLKASSSLDSILAKAVSPERIAAEVRSFAKDELAAILKDKIDESSGLQKQADKIESSLAQYEKTLTEQKALLDSKLKSLPKI